MCCNERIPVGTVNYFARQFSPEGWLLCDGRAVLRDVFADLFNMLGTTVGTGDASTTFNLPDLRGEFIRGYDDGRGVDSDRVFGSAQKGSAIAIDTTKTTTSIVGLYNNVDESAVTARKNAGLDEVDTGTYTGVIAEWSSPAVSGDSYGEIFMGMARPRNVALLACIKY